MRRFFALIMTVSLALALCACGSADAADTASDGRLEIAATVFPAYDFAREIGAVAVVKGLRAITDFEYEFQMTAINYQLDHELETLFIMSTPQHMYLSSSVVREVAAMGGSVGDFVPSCVECALREKFA